MIRHLAALGLVLSVGACGGGSFTGSDTKSDGKGSGVKKSVTTSDGGSDGSSSSGSGAPSASGSSSVTSSGSGTGDDQDASGSASAGSGTGDATASGGVPQPGDDGKPLCRAGTGGAQPSGLIYPAGFDDGQPHALGNSQTVVQVKVTPHGAESLWIDNLSASSHAFADRACLDGTKLLQASFSRGNGFSVSVGNYTQFGFFFLCEGTDAPAITESMKDGAYGGYFYVLYTANGRFLAIDESGIPVADETAYEAIKDAAALAIDVTKGVVYAGSAAELAAGHYAGAKSIPYGQLLAARLTACKADRGANAVLHGPFPYLKVSQNNGVTFEAGPSPGAFP